MWMPGSCGCFRKVQTEGKIRTGHSIDTAKQEGKQEGLAEGMEKGMEKGIEIGKAEGMEKGMNQKALDIARNMLADGVDINLIMKYSGLTQEQIEILK